MYPGQFDYHRASTVDEALSLLTSAGDEDTQILAGGHGLIPAMKTGDAAPDTLVDIGAIDHLRTVEQVADDTVAVGALATHADIVKSDILTSQGSVLPETAKEVADLQIRNRGTVGGNLAEADPEADLPAAMLVEDATIHATGPNGSRTISVTDFFQDPAETALAETELVTEVRIHPATAGAYVKKTHPARGYAMVGVAVAVDFADDLVDSARVATVGAVDQPMRLRSVEDALAGAPIGDPSTVASAAELATDDVPDGQLHGDAYASGEFRREVLPPYVERAVTTALDRASGGEDA